VINSNKESGRPTVSRLDHTAIFDFGGRTLYTPEQARDLAVAILSAADETTGGEDAVASNGTESSDPDADAT